MPDIKPPNQLNELPLALVKNMIVLAASGFGVVVALAWNQLINYLVAEYINPYLGKDGGLASLFIYATAITFIAVLVTMQLTYLQRKLEGFQERLAERQKNKQAAKAALKEKATPTKK
jgi:uncharacterized membrane protein (DUF106 family)